MGRLDEFRDTSLSVEKLLSFNDTFHGRYDADPQHAPQVHRALGTEQSDADRFARLRDLHVARLSSQHDATAIQGIRGYTLRCLANRDWLCVASASGQLTARSDGLLQFRDTPNSEFPTFARPPHPLPEAGSIDSLLVRGDYDIPAAMEFWVGPIGEGAAYILTSEEGVHAYVDLWTGDRSSVNEFLTSVHSNRSLLETGSWVRTTIDELLQLQPWFADLVAFVDDYLSVRLSRQAAYTVQYFGGNEVSIDALWENGMYDVFGNLEVLKAAVAYGLLTSVGFHGRDATEIREWERSHILDVVLIAGLTKNLRLVNTSGDRILI